MFENVVYPKITSFKVKMMINHQKIWVLKYQTITYMVMGQQNMDFIVIE